MSQNKISRRSFLRGAGATATIAAASCMAPSAAACDIKSLWSMDLQILATSDTPVSYTHLDVYKRQGCGRLVKEMLKGGKRCFFPQPM